MSSKIVIILKNDGTITTDANGFRGPICIKETEKLLAGLDAKCQNRRLKAEYNEQKVVNRAVVKE